MLLTELQMLLWKKEKEKTLKEYTEGEKMTWNEDLVMLEVAQKKEHLVEQKEMSHVER
jgi:hypothetical protein